MTTFDKLTHARNACWGFNKDIPNPMDWVDIDTPFECSNGIKMGDPGAKGTLTLMSLIANDEAAIIIDKSFETFDYLSEFGFTVKGDNDPFEFVVSHRQGWKAHLQAHQEGIAPQGTFNPNLKFSKDWTQPNLFSTAGDDQAAIGSLPKLRQISKNHKRNSMVISEEKDLVSPILLLYCERAALRTQYNRMFRSFVGTSYHDHMLLEHLKMRLYSPETKAQDSSNDTNPAFGKAKALTLLVKRLPPGWHGIRDRYAYTRFKQRMFAYLPRTANGQIDPIVDLPAELGGLGLSSNGAGILKVIEAISENHARCILLLLEGDTDRRIPQILSLFSRDRFARGMRFDENFVDALFEDLNENLQPKPIGLDGTAKLNNVDFAGVHGYFAKREILTAQNFIGDKELKTLFSRSALQTKLLTEQTTKGWNHSSWKDRRIAFENSLIRLFDHRISESRAPFMGPVNRQVLATKVIEALPNLSNYVFNEELFYTKEMSQISLQFEGTGDSDPVEIIRQPVQEIIDSLVTMELPPIIDRAWFPRKRTKQNVPGDAEI